MSVSVLGKHARQCCTPDRPRALGRQFTHMVSYVLSIARDKHFLAGPEEQLDALPGVGDQAGRRAPSFEHARRWLKADVGHAVAGDVEHGKRRGIERVVLMRVDVAEMPHVRWHLFRFPAVAADEELAFRQRLRSI